MKLREFASLVILGPAFAWVFFWIAIVNPKRAPELYRALIAYSRGKYSRDSNAHGDGSAASDDTVWRDVGAQP